MELHLRSNNSELYIGANNGNLYLSVLDSNSQRLNYTFCLSEEDLAIINAYFQAHKAANKPEDKSEEKKDEQKSADKVEPFKVGDWVMNKSGATFSNGSISACVSRIEGRKIWLEHGTYVNEWELKKLTD